MELTELVVAVALPIIIYQNYIRPGRYYMLLLKALLFIAPFLPGFALMKWHWARPRNATAGPFEPDKDPTYDVCIFTLISGMFFAVFSCVSLDFAASWTELLQATTMCVVADLAIVAYLAWHMGMRVTGEHLAFLFLDAPGIVCRYVMRLPWDGWADGWWLLKGIASAFSLVADRRPSVHTLRATDQGEILFGNLTKLEL